MNWVCPDEGKSKILDELFRLTSARESFVLDQYLTGGPVTDASTFTDFTLASYGGYAQVAIARGDWSAASVVAHVGQILKTANPVFTCTSGGPQTVNGLLLRGAISGIIYYGFTYPVGIVMTPTATDTISPLEVQHKTFV